MSRKAEAEAGSTGEVVQKQKIVTWLPTILERYDVYRDHSQVKSIPVTRKSRSSSYGLEFLSDAILFNTISPQGLLRIEDHVTALTAGKLAGRRFSSTYRWITGLVCGGRGLARSRVNKDGIEEVIYNRLRK